MHYDRILQRRFLHGITWNTIGFIAFYGSSFVGSVVSARMLNTDAYGEYSMLSNTAQMISGIAGAGLGISATKFVSQYRDRDDTRIGPILGLFSSFSAITSIIFGLLCFIFSNEICKLVLHHSNITILLHFISVVSIFYTINGYQVGALTGFESFKSLAKINFAVGGISLISLPIFISYFGMSGAVSVVGLTGLLNWTLCHITLRRICNQRNIHVSYRQCWSEKGILRTFSAPAALAGILEIIAIWTSNAILVRQHDGFVQMAIFNTSNAFRLVISLCPGLIAGVAAPILSNLVGSGSGTKYYQVFWTNLMLMVSLAGLLAIFIGTFSPFLLHVFGRKYTGDTFVVLVLCAVAVVEVVSRAFFQYVFSTGNMWDQFYVLSGWSFLLVAVAAMLARNFGGFGLSMAYLVAAMFNLTSYILLFLRRRRVIGVAV